MSETQLRDGSRIKVRPVRSSDAGLLLRGFERLSDESRYRRFLCSMPELSESMVRYLTDVDHLWTELSRRRSRVRVPSLP